jgi:elongation factor G
MGKYRTAEIRNVALVGHTASGKTSLIDATLYVAQAVDRLGRVDQKTSMSDFDEEEKERQKTLESHILFCDWSGHHLNLVDTPGSPDLVGACFSVLPAVELAVLVVDASVGVQVHTRKVNAKAIELGLARLVVFNKCDLENIDFAALTHSVRESLGANCVFLNLPDGLGNEFRGVVDVLNPPSPIPPRLPLDLEAERSKLIDAAVEGDEELMMRYLEGETLSATELSTAIQKAVARGSLVPIVCTSALAVRGVTELLDAVVRFGPPPQAIPRYLEKKVDGSVERVPLEVREDGPPVAYVFKTVTDPFVGKLSYLRIFSGRLQSESSVLNQRTRKASRLAQLFYVQGKQQIPVSEAVAGELVAVAKVDDFAWGDTIGETHGALFPLLKLPQPMFSLAVEPKSRGDEQKISSSLARMAEEDMTFRVHRDPETRELVISGISELHLEVIRARLRRRFGLEMNVKTPRIGYRETITSKTEGSYRHKKQTGGRGQFAEVHLRLFPLPRNEKIDPEKFVTKEMFPQARNYNYHEDLNFLFIDSIVGGVIPNQFIPAVEKGVRETMEAGVLAGYTVQDIAVEVFFGKDHPVDSSEAAFKIASAVAFKEAFLKDKPVLLEPIVNMEVMVPVSNMGDVMSDLSSRRARILGSETLPGGWATIRAQAPLAEVMEYARVLGSITAGQGSYTLEPSHYDVVPPHLQQQIVEQAQRERHRGS